MHSVSPSLHLLLAASPAHLASLLPVFACTAPATLHLATLDVDAAWHLQHTQPDLLILESSLLQAGSALLDARHAPPAAPHVLYLGPTSGLALLPPDMAASATALPWPSTPELIQTWLSLFMRQHADHVHAAAPLQAGSLQLDLHRFIARVGPSEVALTATETNLLAVLLRHVGTLVSRTRLDAATLDATPDPKKRRLDSHISNLRRKLRQPDSTRQSSPCIHSYRGRGYMLTVDAAPA